MPPPSGPPLGGEGTSAAAAVAGETHLGAASARNAPKVSQRHNGRTVAVRARRVGRAAETQMNGDINSALAASRGASAECCVAMINIRVTVVAQMTAQHNGGAPATDAARCGLGGAVPLSPSAAESLAQS